MLIDEAEHAAGAVWSAAWRSYSSFHQSIGRSYRHSRPRSLRGSMTGAASSGVDRGLCLLPSSARCRQGFAPENAGLAARHQIHLLLHHTVRALPRAHTLLWHAILTTSCRTARSSHRQVHRADDAATSDAKYDERGLHQALEAKEGCTPSPRNPHPWRRSAFQTFFQRY